MTLETIILKKFNTKPEDFRELQDYECPIVSDIVVRDEVAKYCTGPFHATPTVKDMMRIHGDVKYFRLYPN